MEISERIVGGLPIPDLNGKLTIGEGAQLSKDKKEREARRSRELPGNAASLIANHQRAETPMSVPPPEEEYPSCETTLWQIGQWRCEYWRPEGQWRGSSLRLFRGDRLVRTVEFGLRAREQSNAWRIAVRKHPTMSPGSLVDENDAAIRAVRQPLATEKNNSRK